MKRDNVQNNFSQTCFIKQNCFGKNLFDYANVVKTFGNINLCVHAFINFSG